MNTLASMPNPPSRWRLPVTAALLLLAPPLSIVAWILLSGDWRPLYWRSWWVRGALAVAILGALPLLVVGMATELGLTADRNPNPVGLGLLFVAALVLACIMALAGVIWTHLSHRAD